MSTHASSILSCSEALSAVAGTSIITNPADVNQTEQDNEFKEAGSQCSSASVPQVQCDTSPDHRMSLSSNSVILATDSGDTSHCELNKTIKKNPRRGIDRRRKTKVQCFSLSEEEALEIKKAILFDMDKEESGDDGNTEFAIRKKAFILSLMDSCASRGYLTCKLCRKDVWGPNGRYHIEKCRVIRKYRSNDNEAMVLRSINGLRIHEEFFAKPKALKPKLAKIPGFVMSNTVLLSDPRVAPSLSELKAGAVVGRKGYTRCLACNSELFAPNTRRHALSCSRRWATLEADKMTLE